jgi:hypothetical protein
VTESRPRSPNAPQRSRFPRLWGKPAIEDSAPTGVLAFNNHVPAPGGVLRRRRGRPDLPATAVTPGAIPDGTTS